MTTRAPQSTSQRHLPAKTSRMTTTPRTVTCSAARMPTTMCVLKVRNENELRLCDSCSASCSGTGIRSAPFGHICFAVISQAYAVVQMVTAVIPLNFAIRYHASRRTVIAGAPLPHRHHKMFTRLERPRNHPRPRPPLPHRPLHTLALLQQFAEMACVSWRTCRKASRVAIARRTVARATPARMVRPSPLPSHLLLCALRCLFQGPMHLRS